MTLRNKTNIFFRFSFQHSEPIFKFNIQIQTMKETRTIICTHLHTLALQPSQKGISNYYNKWRKSVLKHYFKLLEYFYRVSYQ